MTSEELMIKGMLADLPQEDKARYEATLQKLTEAVDLENTADLLAASMFSIKMAEKLRCSYRRIHPRP